MKSASFQCLIALAAFFCCGTSHAEGIDGTYPAPPLGVLVDNAAKISVIRITDRKPIYDLSSFDKPLCGYLLTAKVIEAFKGGDAPFDFFSPVEKDFSGFDKRYFVFAFKKGGASPTALSLPIDRKRGDLVAKEHCMALHQLYVPIQFQTLWTFDDFAQRSFGGEWLAGANRTDGILCGFGAEDGRRFHIQSVAGIRVKFGERGYSTNWSDAETTIRRAIPNPYSEIGCGMD